MKERFVMFSLILLLIAGLCQPLEAGFIGKETIDGVQADLIKKHGEQNRFRIERGVVQVARFWRKEDGGPKAFAGFCKKFFIGSPKALEANFKRMEMFNEILEGYYTEMAISLKQPLHLDWGPIMPIDMAFGQYNPAAHLADDLFNSKIAFTVLLNFPHYSLEEKTKLGDKWSRKEWAYARAGDAFTSRIPAAASQQRSKAVTVADTYISEYNIFMGQLVDKKFNTFFPKKMKLITHWNLRDEIKARYKDTKGLYKQKMIYKVMERIIYQDIPGKVVNNDKYQWNPFTNKVFENKKEIKVEREPDTRYRHLLNIFKANRAADPHNPYYPSLVSRRFDSNREIPEAEVEALFVELLSSKEVKKVAKLIRKRLKRKLLPHDIWYNGFRQGVPVTEEELDKITAKKYPTLQAFEDGIDEILVKLGFPKDKAVEIASKIRVDGSRGAGHCIGAALKTAKARLRTRVPKGGMDYKGFNIAVHELGHAVESTITLQDMDYYTLSGVPNTAFTEAFAFVFQHRDLEILGIESHNPDAKHYLALDIFWNSYEIMGVSLVDMKVWNWMYKHPDATPAQLKEAVIKIAKDVWNKYYAPVFKVKDQAILAIYSHMIDASLYLPDYPIGHVIHFQIEDYLHGKTVGKEMPRMLSPGNVIPQVWMKNAVGSKISVKPLLKAAGEAVKKLK